MSSYIELFHTCCFIVLGIATGALAIAFLHPVDCARVCLSAIASHYESVYMYNCATGWVMLLPLYEPAKTAQGRSLGVLWGILTCVS